MYPTQDWINKCAYKAKQILDEAHETLPITLPIPITKVVKLYVPNTQVFRTREPEITSSISACATRDVVNGWTILVNGNETIRRQRFSIAHELGHMTLIPNADSTVYCGKSSGWEEKVCDIFAGKILVPDELLLKFTTNNPNPYLEDVVVTFQVSPEVAHIRMRDLSLPYRTMFAYPFLHR